MSKIDAAIRTVLANEFAQGSSLSASAIKQIGEVRRSAARLGLIVFAATLVVFVITAFISIYYIRDATTLAAATGALGLSLAGALEVLRRTWKDWGEANLLMILLAEAREDQVDEMLKKLIGKI